MAATAIGPIKAMVLSLDASAAQCELEAMLADHSRHGSLRALLQALASASTSASSAAHAFASIPDPPWPPPNFDLILRRYEEIGARLSAGSSGGGAYAALSREFAELEPVVEAIRAWRAKEKERADLDALLAESGLDPEMRSLAEADAPASRRRSNRWRRRSSSPSCPRTWPTNATSFSKCERGRRRRGGPVRRRPLSHVRQIRGIEGWKVEVLSASEGTAGGYKEVVAGSPAAAPMRG